MSSAKSALIFGATGQTGRHLLRELIASPTFTRVCEAGRRVTPADKLPAQASGKIEQKVIDFERLEEAGLKEGQWDVVFIAMGTTAKNAGSQITKIDKDKDFTEQALAELGYKNTVMFRPAVLSNTNRPESRLVESAILAMTGVVSRFSDKVQIDVDKLATKSVRIVGEQGTSNLPSGARAQQTSWGGEDFTVIDNPSALALSK